MKCLFIRFLYLTAIFPLCVMASPQVKNAATWQEVSDNKVGEIVILYYPEEAFAYKDKSDLPTGIQLDILTQFVNWVQNTKGVSLNVSWIEQENFEQLLSDVKNAEGGVFGAANITITDSRKQQFSFSPSYMSNISVLITHNSVADINSLQQIPEILKGMSAVVQRGSTHLATLQKLKRNYLPSLVIRQVESDKVAVDLVSENPKIFSYIDLALFLFAQNENKTIKRQPAGDESNEEFGFIMPLNSDWKPLFDEFFEQSGGYRSSFPYKRILMRHLGTEITKMLELKHQ